MAFMVELVFSAWCIGRLVRYADALIPSNNCSFDERCICQSFDNFNIIVDCSSSSLKTFPTLPPNTRIAHFESNNITDIADETFKNSNLFELDLSDNQIIKLRRKMFDGLTQLIVLRLISNEICQIKADAFNYLNNLLELFIHNNHVEWPLTNVKFPSTLEYLQADVIGYNQTLFTEEIRNLQELVLSGREGKCNMTVVTRNTFKKTPHIQSLDVSACKINFIYRHSFDFLTNLTRLDISHNVCLKFAGLENVTMDLPSTSIQTLSFNKIHQTFEMNTLLRKLHVAGLKNTKLKEIHADSNRIQLIEKGALGLFPKTLRNVSLSDNMLSYGDYFKESIVSPVTFLNASYMFTAHEPPHEPPEVCVKKSEHDLAYKYFTSSPDTPNIIVLHKSPIPLPFQLKQFIYKGGHLRYEIPYLKLSNNAIEYLDASYNTFYSWIGPLMETKKLVYVDLSNNLCSHVSNVFFKGAPYIKTLMIQNNYLGLTFPSDTKGEIFQYLTQLENLNASGNRISFLPFDFFKEQKTVKNLSLAENMLDDITFNMEQMANLSYLDLSRNRIFSLNEKARKQLDGKKYIYLDLSGNPLRCACDTLEFLKWMSFTKVNFINLESYTCLSSVGKTSLSDPDSVYKTFDKICSNHVAVIITGSILLVLFSVVVFFGLIYRYRWRLRYVFYITRNKFKINVAAENKIYKYDAFISYSEEDSAFVHKKLLKTLEGTANLRLCIHKRDFLPGTYIAENITVSIHNSRKVVVIMSRNLLKSKWGMYEYNIAKTESIYSRSHENILYLVFLEQLSCKDLPLQVLEQIESESYIEYPDDEYGDQVFFQKLLTVLKPNST